MTKNANKKRYYLYRRVGEYARQLLGWVQSHSECEALKLGRRRYGNDCTIVQKSIVRRRR